MAKTKKRILKLFVWEGVLIDYTDGIMFALAYDVEHARKIILKKNNLDAVRRDIKNKPDIYRTPKGFAVYGGG